MKRCIDTNKYANVAMLQIRSIPIDHTHSCQAPILFNMPIGGLLPKINMEPILRIFDYDNYATLNNGSNMLMKPKIQKIYH